MADDLSCNVRRAVACNENADDKLLAKLSMDKDDIVRENVAENPKTGSLTLEEMAEHDAVIDVKLAALGNPNIPTRVIHRMAAGTGKRVRETIAGNISTPKTILMKSARDRDTNVAYNVACNPNVPREALTILAERRNIGILVAVVRNKNTPEEALAKLARNNNRNLRLLIAEHENTSRETLEFLLLKAVKEADQKLAETVRLALAKQ